MVLDRLRHRAEDDALLGQLLVHRGAHRDRVEHHVHRYTGELGALVQRNAELVVGVDQLLRHLVQRFVFGALGRGVVAERLQVDRRDVELGPVGHRHRQPVAVGVQAPLRHPLGLFLDRGKLADDVLVQARRQAGGLDVGDETGFVGPSKLRVDLAVGVLARRSRRCGRSVDCLGGHWLPVLCSDTGVSNSGFRGWPVARQCAWHREPRHWRDAVEPASVPG